MSASVNLNKIHRLLNNISTILIESRVKSSNRLIEVGKLETVKKSENYGTGQLFLHKIFAYRGVILFPWEARVFDRDRPNNTQDKQEKEVGKGDSTFSSTTTSTSSAPTPTFTTYSEDKEVKGSSQTFYQVLMDSRDFPFIRSQAKAVTFLGNKEGSISLYAIPGLDYASHEDILPYTTKQKNPIYHELFDKFLTQAPSQQGTYVAKDALKAWQKENRPWLELSDVHQETTDSVRITVIPFYMGSRNNQNSIVYWWRYCIRIENLGTKAVQLRERHWRIFSLSGTLETVRGRGIVGQEPLLNKSSPAFQYSSHVTLQAPSGHMWGTFRMEREDGYKFDCRIPPFLLESKSNEENPNPPNFFGS